MTGRESLRGRLLAALAARPATTAASVPLRTRTRLASALAARPIVAPADTTEPTDDRPRTWSTTGDKFASRVKLVVAELLGIGVDQLRLDSDGDIGIRAGSAMIFVRAQEDPPLVDVFSPLLSGVQPDENLYRRLSELTNEMALGRIYCTGDTVWASVPVFGQDFQATHLLLAIQAMVRLADDLDDQLRREFGGSRFFGPEATGIVGVPDPTGYLRDLAEAGESGAGRILADLLADRGHVNELRALAESGAWHAASRLAALLHDEGHTDEAEHFWRLAADAGESTARAELADLLVARGRPDEAIALLRAGVADGDWRCVGMLLTLLTRQGRQDEAMALLRTWATGPPDPR